MKTLVMLLSLFASGPALALPVLNANAPGSEGVTVLPDHADKNLFYLAPTVFLVATQEGGLPNFSYMEFVQGGSLRAVVQTTLRPDFNYSGIAKARAAILAANPAARFAAIPFEESRVAFSGSIRDLIVQSDCQHTAGTVADEQTCAFKLNRRGIQVMKPMLKSGLTISTQIQYTINGVRENPDGSYSAASSAKQVAGRIGGPELAAYPQLFRDRRGNVIKGLSDTLNW